MRNLSLSEQLMYSTVRIECLLTDGSTSTGTGFFFNFLEHEGSHIPCIVTNKHVIQGAVQGQFILSKADNEGNPINTEHVTTRFNNFETMWILHPEQNVDLCILPIAPVVQRANEQGDRVFYISLNKSLIPSQDQLNQLSALEDITMIGYPNGLWDRVNNLPIMRKGVTASHPRFNHNGREEIIIDAACFPGSSGSPVVLFNEGAFRNQNGFNVGSRILLLGILYAGPQFTSTGEIRVLNIPNRPVSVSQIPMNLGYVIKSHKLLDFEVTLESMSNPT